MAKGPTVRFFKGSSSLDRSLNERSRKSEPSNPYVERMLHAAVHRHSHDASAPPQDLRSVAHDLVKTISANILANHRAKASVNAIEALGTLGLLTKEVFDVLSLATEASDESIRSSASESLRKLGVVHTRPGEFDLRGVTILEDSEAVAPVADERDHQYTDEMLEEKIVQLANSAGIPPKNFEWFKASIEHLIEEARVQHAPKQRPLPKRAREIFKDRRDKSEDIIQFLIRVWTPWMDSKSLSRPELARLDPSAEKAVRNWLYQHPEQSLPSEIYLPTKRQVHDEILARDPRAVLKSPKLAQAVASRLRRHSLS